MPGKESKVSNPACRNTELDQDTQKNEENVLRRRHSGSVRSTTSSNSVVSGSSKQTSEAMSNPRDGNIAHKISEGLQKGNTLIFLLGNSHIIPTNIYHNNDKLLYTIFN